MHSTSPLAKFHCIFHLLMGLVQWIQTKKNPPPKIPARKGYESQQDQITGLCTALLYQDFVLTSFQSFLTEGVTESQGSTSLWSQGEISNSFIMHFHWPEEMQSVGSSGKQCSLWSPPMLTGGEQRAESGRVLDGPLRWCMLCQRDSSLGWLICDLYKVDVIWQFRERFKEPLTRW